MNPSPEQIQIDLMNKTKRLLRVIVVLLLVCAGSGYAGWYIGIHSQAISRAVATGIALSQVGPGTILNARLDRSDGMPVWEINLLQPNKPGVTEVRVHALTSDVVAVRNESLTKAGKELSEVAEHLGITAEHLKPKPHKKSKGSPPLLGTAPPSQETEPNAK